MEQRMAHAVVVASLVFGAPGCRAPRRVETVRVAAAADLVEAFGALAARFEASSGARVTLTFGSSGLLARQIAEGAPFELFASADAGFADRAVASGRCVAEGRRPYALGRLAVIARPGLPVPTSLAGLVEPRFARIAVANPEHAPYGRAALDALARAGLRARLQPRLVFAENVRQAQRYALAGEADAAIVARSLVGPERGPLVIPAAGHAPLTQVLVFCGEGARRALVRRFADFVTGPEGRAELTRRGFD